MSYNEEPSLEALREQLAAILETRTAELLAEIKATQLLARQLEATESDLARYRALRSSLESELAAKSSG